MALSVGLFHRPVIFSCSSVFPVQTWRHTTELILGLLSELLPVLHNAVDYPTLEMLNTLYQYEMSQLKR